MADAETSSTSSASASVPASAPGQPFMPVTWAARFTDEQAKQACLEWLDEAASLDHHLARRALPVHEAWAIAMAWQEQLQQYVHLKPTTDAQGITQNYAWVRIKSPARGSTEDMVPHALAARAAAITWHALSRCPGYGPRENPVFWLHVFGVLRHNPTESVERWGCPPPRSYFSPVSGAVRFFDDLPECEVFPRITLDFKHPTLLTTFFLGTRNPDRTRDTEDSARLDGILHRLRPLMKTMATPQEIPVHLEGRVSDTKMDQFLTSMRQELAPVGEQTSPNSLVPRFVVSEHGDMHYDLTSRRRLQSDSIPQERADKIASVFQIGDANASSSGPDPGRSVRSSRVDDIPSLCSALPHTRAVVFARVEISAVTPSELQAAWLGYALFHPDTPASTWQTLHVDQFSMVSATMEQMRSMAMGNNLLAAVTGNQVAPSPAYYSTRLKEGTALYAEPSETSAVLWTTHGDQQCHVDICVPGECEMALIGEWVCVVARGWGHGWVNKEALGEITARPPSPISLDTLRLMSDARSVSGGGMRRIDPIAPDTIACLASLMPLLGTSLRQLDIEKLAQVDEVALLAILRHCPHLEVLTVFHDEVFWADESRQAATLPCRLSQLSLSVARSDARPFVIPSNAALHTVLSTLTVLRITPPHYYSEFADDRDALLKLLDRLPGLQYLHYNKQHIGIIPEPYATCRKNTWKKMDLAGNRISAYAVRPLPVRSRLAFCSVTKQHATTTSSALGRFDLHVNSGICELAGDCVPRVVWVGE